jgi:hypothetical protein
MPATREITFVVTSGDQNTEEEIKGFQPGLLMPTCASGPHMFPKAPRCLCYSFLSAANMIDHIAMMDAS